MRLFSYVVSRDFGFAPNPFFQTCTLATCKPRVRSAAERGDWIIGTGSKAKGREGYLVFAMRVTEKMTFSEYWNDVRLQCKKPNLSGSKKQAFGDNIYFHDEAGSWTQVNSHHSCPDGSPNLNNVERDTSVDRVLLSDDFLYWGGSGPAVPSDFDVCKRGPGHRSHFRDAVVGDLVAWLRVHQSGFTAPPGDWSGMEWQPFNRLLRF